MRPKADDNPIDYRILIPSIEVRILTGHPALIPKIKYFLRPRRFVSSVLAVKMLC